MRTNIEIDDVLLHQAMAAGGFKTKKQTVEEALKLLARQQVYRDLAALRGQVEMQTEESIADALVAGQ